MRKRPLCTMCLIFLVIRSAILLCTGGKSLVKIPASSFFLEGRKETEVTVCGQVYKKTITSKVQMLYLKNNSLVQESKSYQESNLLIYDDTFTQIPVGKTVCIRGKAKGFERARNPGNFDQQLYYAKQNIYGSVWSKEMISVSGKEDWLHERLYQIRQKWKAILQENMSRENEAVLAAMLLNEKSEMEQELKEEYQKAGISHVLAISGLHISFIGLGIYKGIRKSGIPYAGAGFCAALILSMYVLMIGFSVSVIRAFVMLLLKIGADMTGRIYDMLTALMLAAAIIVSYQPLYLADAAFYLSHGAVLGILVILPQIRKLFPKFLQRRWMEGIYAGAAVLLATFPVLLWFYFEFPICSIFTNLLVIPLMGILLFLGIFGSIGCFIWNPAGKQLFWGCEKILNVFQWISEKSCELPIGRITAGRPDFWKIVLYYILLAGFICLLARCRRHKGMTKIRGLAILFSAAVIVLFARFPNGRLQITMLDVGQGDCIFMQGPEGGTYLVDGGSSDVREAGRYRIEPFLKARGVASLDYVLVSHGDSDHYNGIEEMLERQLLGVQIKVLVFPADYLRDKELAGLAKLARRQGTKVAVIKPGQSIVEGKLLIQCLQPDGKEELEGNAGSMILDVSFQKFDMLFTGDVEKEGETLLLKKLLRKNYDILKVAHHGSKYSTEEAFLKLVRPKISWISAGKGNSYGHPHKETLERIKKYGAQIYQTMEYGAISVETNGDFIDIFPSSI